jgi:hypothetical protein
MEIVGAFGCSHSGLIITRRDPDAEGEQKAFFQAFERMGTEILALEPKAIIVIGTDHGRIFDLKHVPQFTLGVGKSVTSIGDAGLPVEEIQVEGKLARAILSGMLQEGIDLAFSEAMSIDHSFIAPLTLAFGNRRLPIIPIIQNCNLPPLPTLRRSYEVGQALGRALRNGPPGKVVLLGTGGLSHWVGSPAYQAFLRAPAGTRLAVASGQKIELTDSGYVNADFDQNFLRLLSERRARDFLAEWDTDRIYEDAGNGGQEIRNWLMVAGAIEDAPAQVLSYYPAVQWLTGTAIARFDLGRAAA